jgi:hypothetical protein
MTDQHRATPEQWEYQERWASDDDDASCILELRDRVEALEAAQLEQAESNRFCTDAIVRRVEALEAAQQDKLDRLIALDRDDPTPDADMTDYERVAANMASCPSIDRIPDFTGASPTTPELRAASAEVRPAERLWERMEKAGQRELDDNPHAEQAEFYEAMIREVAAWLREGGDYSADAWADLLEREVFRG